MTMKERLQIHREIEESNARKLREWKEREDKKMEDKIIGCGVVIAAVRFTYMDETTVQDGIMVHDINDENHDGDEIYGSWTVDMIGGPEDIEYMLKSGDGTTYWHRNADGTYTIDA